MAIDSRPVRKRWRDMRVWLALASIGFVLALSWGIVQSIRLTTYERHLGSIYSKSFADLVDSVDALQLSLEKAQVASTGKYSKEMMDKVWQQAEISQNQLGILPGSLGPLSGATKLVNQVGDYGYSVGVVADDQENGQQLQKLTEYCTRLSEELHAMQDAFRGGQLSWSELVRAQDITELSGFEPISDGVERISKETEEHPALLYDGPFSDSLSQREPKTSQLPEVSAEEAAEKARSFSGGTVEAAGESNGQIPAYMFNYTREDGQRGLITITKNGGRVLNMTCAAGQPGEEEGLALEELMKIGADFLAQHDFGKMEPSYAQVYDGGAVINYASVQDGVTLYPDLVKLKLSLTDGHVVAIDARNYIMCHEERALEPPAMSEQQIRELVNPNITIDSVRRCVIPTDGGGEVSCYEVKGKKDDQVYLLYFNDQTGDEERIFKLVDTGAGGQLTM